METTPPLDRFDEAYRSRSAPWVIGEPQPAIVGLRRAGLIHGKVLDVGRPGNRCRRTRVRRLFAGHVELALQRRSHPPPTAPDIAP